MNASGISSNGSKKGDVEDDPEDLALQSFIFILYGNSTIIFLKY